MSDYIIEAENLIYTYPDGTQALRGINIKIPKGKKVAVLGSNGAGKSTLFLQCNGILKPQQGIVKYDGKEVRYDRKSLLHLRKNVGIVFQDPDSQLFSASVYQEISFGPLNFGLPEETVRKRVERAMLATEVAGLKEKPTHMLSYGQKKRVSIADILVMEPEVIICDEPTAWLDPKHAQQTVKLFDRINSGGTTIMMSTHDVDLAYSWADYIFVLSNGEVIGEGIPEQVFTNEILIKKADLEKPWLVQVSEVLLIKGCLPKAVVLPRNRESLFELIINHGTNVGEEEIINDFGDFRNKGRERDHISADLKGL
ncbi:energy-coupling factor ABC transporter ATP-binding protein [Phosphitispora fastidiosa]|uniref:energy-coupling factor ABC transporter ATP-binding protein n=1 Tax=Phosphitispora fastidiosa TaxID=2837202 RepID=UPI001E481471|nr:ATP-binding cassette domain-containing protein [Phosphitispora fastidiosa]MBU7005842.1 cobalt/nickel transport system ATP-binding protein [Phosphitispora fastidiosa]